MKPRTVVVAGAALVAAYVVTVVGVYIWHLGSLPFSKDDPGRWGQFGDYLGGLLNPLFALLNVAVVVYIAISVQRLNEREKKREDETEKSIKVVIDLHREWNGESIYRSRTIAGKLVRRSPASNVFELEDLVPYEEAAHIWVVIGFFQRLAYLIQHQRVDRQMTLELFAELFVWWWVLSFDRQLTPCECDARNQMLELKKWFYTNTTDEQRAPWLRRAQRDLAVAEENFNAPPIVVV